MAGPSFPSAFLWPMLAAMSASEATAAFVHDLARMTATEAPLRPPLVQPEWTTPNTIVLELPTLSLRDFSSPGQPADTRPTLICAPYALHGATVADFAPGHSLVEVLRACGRRNLHLAEWRSATPGMRYFSIDTLLADLNVAVDEFGEPVDLIGICQGGWMALLFAARFPRKVRRLVIGGAPLDLAAGDSGLSRLAATTPLSAFTELLRFGDGRLLGQLMLGLWGPAPTTPGAIRHELQLPPPNPDLPPSVEEEALHQRFRDWYDWTVDLPGTYYLQVVEWLYKENRLARGEFVALGRRIDLSAVRLPVLLLAGRDDALIGTAAVLAAAKALGTPRENLVTQVTPATHLGLFMGRGCLTETWPGIVAWLDRSEPSRPAATAA
ncbi:MAG: poly(3-hydroxyalkanoate) synthetase [Rhodoplanes sp.]|uniref:poly(3-hydroxyalkanoate) synthetase n=1 Tax=Rhodoplanes sp. TaxID=1968906 RepID=UPI0018253E79|nr:poly(3-hydroxyalkanoate) synthetase [Rhodoplanes sp.]NVO15192.1 poly(3-hydroxyalkanoate) synthetase [Rhodoplanes sp.]